MGVCSHQCGHKHHCQHTYPSHRYKEIRSTLCTILPAKRSRPAVIFRCFPSLFSARPSLF